MTYFTRLKKVGERTYDGSFAAAGKGAPPKHVRDKNGSHSAQGANGTTPEQEAELGQEGVTDAQLDADTTRQ